MKFSRNTSNKYTLTLCEIHNEYIHGYIPQVSSDSIKGHWICQYVLDNKYDNISVDDDDDTDDDDNESDDNDSDDQRNNTKTEQWILSIFDKHTKYNKDEYINQMYNLNNLKHEFIQNYKNIVLQANYIKPQIALIIKLPGDEVVAILKTFWIKCVQRCWKRLYKKRQEIIKIRKHPNSIMYRMKTGYWEHNCFNYPEVKGMFWNNYIYI